MGKWKRPDNVPFPSIWRTFEKTGADGAVQIFWVQDIAPEFEEMFLENMRKVFVPDEALCKYSKMDEDPQAVQAFSDLWKHAITHKLGLICLTKNENDKIEIVGGNMTTISEKDDQGELGENTLSPSDLASAMSYVAKQRNIFNELNINEYLSAYGLYVLPKFRGLGIGTEILKARRELCLAVGIKVSATIFSSIISQKTAKKAGFQDFFEIDYDELEKINPKWCFPGITALTKTNTIKNMYIQYS